ncbi:MAG: M23 family metallopeptidase [Mariprofundaceae bacterium]|nr:M23 family metallopeptidase [Mariprofundaceae bacterium]
MQLAWQIHDGLQNERMRDVIHVSSFEVTLLKHFSLMLVPDSGPVRSYRIRKTWLLLSALLMLILGACSAWGVYAVYQTEHLSIALEKSQHTLSLLYKQQKNEFLNMQTQLGLEHEKVAMYVHHLGELKARMIRLNALGKHLLKSSKMKDDSFDFDMPPAMGGPPIAASDLTVNPVGLGQKMVSMNTQITHLDAQLEAIDMFLQGDREEKIAKPHAWPTKGGWLSSHFGMRDDPFTGRLAMHKGVDIANHFGAAVLSASRGVVIFAGKMRGYGYLIEIDHGYGYRTRYAHMSSAVVKVGDLVEDAQLIGRIGSVGRSTGPHLHFEVLRFGKAINPQPFLPHA